MNSASTFTQKFQCSKKPKPSGVMASVFLLDASVGSYMGQQTRTNMLGWLFLRPIAHRFHPVPADIQKHSKEIIT